MRNAGATPFLCNDLPSPAFASPRSGHSPSVRLASHGNNALQMGGPKHRKAILLGVYLGPRFPNRIRPGVVRQGDRLADRSAGVQRESKPILTGLS